VFESVRGRFEKLTGWAAPIYATLAIEMPVEIHPRKLVGSWTMGYALDFQTTSSMLIGYNAFGHPEFDTKRPPVGELLYRLKNRGDATAIEPLADVATAFIRNWPVDSIVPIPPSIRRGRGSP